MFAQSGLSQVFNEWANTLDFSQGVLAWEEQGRYWSQHSKESMLKMPLILDYLFAHCPKLRNRHIQLKWPLEKKVLARLI